MNNLENLFPPPPTFFAKWQAIYIEPIVGSGERISIAVLAIGANNEYKIIQAIREDLLDCLYGSNAKNMQSIIRWVIESANNELKYKLSLSEWEIPVDGVIVGELRSAADESIDGILQQAIRFSSSLSKLAPDLEREGKLHSKRNMTENWGKSISNEMLTINPNLSPFFRKSFKLSKSEAYTTFGFCNNKYVSNFGILAPERLSASLLTMKSKLFDLGALKKSKVPNKIESYEMIISISSFTGLTQPSKSINKAEEKVQMLTEVAASESIGIFKAGSAKEAAMHINQIAA